MSMVRTIVAEIMVCIISYGMYNQHGMYNQLLFLQFLLFHYIPLFSWEWETCFFFLHSFWKIRIRLWYIFFLMTIVQTIYPLRMKIFDGIISTELSQIYSILNITDMIHMFLIQTENIYLEEPTLKKINPKINL